MELTIQNRGISQNHRNEQGVIYVDELNSLISEAPCSTWHVVKLSSRESTIDNTSKQAVVPSKNARKFTPLRYVSVILRFSFLAA